MSLQAKEICVCDQCGREREKDTNHWWLLARKFADMGVFLAWNDNEAYRPGVQHLCGLTCLYQAIDKLAQAILKQETVAK